MTDPLYPRSKTHLARFIAAEGSVSPWCFKRPRPLKLGPNAKVVTSAAGNWRAVTCKRCREAFAKAHRDLDGATNG